MMRIVTARARLVVAAAAILTATSVAFGSSVTRHMNGGTDQFTDRASESSRTFDRLAAALGEQPDPQALALVRTGPPRPVASRIAALPEVARTAVRGDLVLVFFRPGDATVRRGADHLVALLGDDPGILLGGGAIAGRQIRDTVREDLLRSELIAFPLVLLLSLWVFRGLVGALMPPLVGAIAVGLTLLALRIVSGFTDLSVFSVNIVTGLGLGLAIDYSLLVVSRYREELARHGPTTAAIEATIRSAGRTVAWSAVTVAAAMASLFVFPQQFLWSMAVGGTIVALTAGIAAVVVLPAVLHLLGNRIDALAPAAWRHRASRGGWGRFARWVMRRPLVIAVACAALLLALATPALDLRFTAIDATVLPADLSARKLADELDRRGIRGASSPLNVVFSGLPPARAVERAAALAGVAHALPTKPVGEGLWRLDVLPIQPPASAETRGLVRELRRIFPTAHVTGQGAAYVDQLAGLGARLPWAFLALGLTTLVLLFGFTGSVVLPLKALVMNVLSIGAAFGILVLVFQRGKGVPGLESTQPILLCTTAFGLATDYAVFLLSRIREARRSGLGERASVADGLERTGGVVTAAALLFCVAVGSFATSRLVFVQELGVGTAVAVALDASIVRALLVPSLMALLGRFNWWAPGLLRRVHARFSLGP
jgi:RND superfamily putative drug exporter